MTIQLFQSITVRDLIEDGAQIKEIGTVFVPTAWGPKEVSYVKWPESDPWVYCPKDNGGFGMSYCVHYGTELLLQL